MAEPEYRSARLTDPVWRDARQLARELSADLADDLSLSEAIGVAVRYGRANRETLVQWARDQRNKESDH
jgi:hypothetical protein